MLSSSERFWTIPNILSLYRILIFPFVLYLIFVGNEPLFTVFIIISLLSDILDGFIARTFNQQTQVGARLDSWADLGTYFLAFYAVYIFKWEVLKPHALMLIVYAFALVLTYVVVLLKFKALIGLHTYLFKITGYLQGAFIIFLFLWGFNAGQYYFSLCFGIIACIEEIIIAFLLSKPRSNVKGLWWVLKNKQA
jgi:CDP-diacylglycerol--glycerol-3-phosphate 3-phosphatidyltransferase